MDSDYASIDIIIAKIIRMEHSIGKISTYIILKFKKLYFIALRWIGYPVMIDILMGLHSPDSNLSISNRNLYENFLINVRIYNG